MKQTNHFITGGAGFIGSHLADKLLLNEESQVTVFDNFSSGRMENISHLMGNPRFHLIGADMLDYTDLRLAMKDADVIWHLGANTDIRRGNQDSTLDLDNCTIATRNVLECMVSLKIKHLIFASSATVYGDAPPVPLSETYGPLMPISLYGAAKLACEGLISAYSHLYGIHARIFRFANIVGSRMGHGVIYDFIEKLKANPNELEILGDGNQRKPFLLVDDCIEGMLCASVNGKEQCGIYNLGCGSVTVVSEIADIVSEQMGLTPEFKFAGGERGWLGDVPIVYFNILKMRELGWHPKQSSTDAIRIATRALIEELTDEKGN